MTTSLTVTAKGQVRRTAAVACPTGLVLNVPLNHDLNHRFFEVMASGAPQVVFGDPGLVLRLFAEPEQLRAIPVALVPQVGRVVYNLAAVWVEGFLRARGA
jgi:hypothetical protein